MKNELLRHKLAYAVLLTGILIFVVLFLAAWPDRWLQRLVILGLTFYYFAWGVLTHFKTQTITKSVVWEYGMVSLLAGVLLLLITV